MQEYPADQHSCYFCRDGPIVEPVTILRQGFAKESDTNHHFCMDTGMLVSRCLVLCLSLAAQSSDVISLCAWLEAE